MYSEKTDRLIKYLLERSVIQKDENFSKMTQLITQVLDGADVVLFLATNQSILDDLEDGDQIAEVYRTGRLFSNELEVAAPIEQLGVLFATSHHHL